MPGLFSPLQVGSVSIRNRVTMPPMVTGKGAEDGTVTPAILDHYGARAEAGTGLIIVEATYVDGGGRCWRNGLGAAEDRHVPGLASLVERIHAVGAVAAIQLVHGGPQASAEVSGSRPVGPSPIPPSSGAGIPRELTVDGIAAIEERFADAAARCAAAGFDAVEMHGAHGFLLDSFLSARRNRRADGYGGSAAGRMRMLAETCRQVRARLGDRARLICRISLFNKEPGEFSPETFELLVKSLEEAGIDLLHLSTDGVLHGSFGEPASLGQWVKRFSDVCVIAAGGLGDPLDANRAIAEGHCDLAAIGNAMYEDPQWTAKARRALGV